MRLNELDKTNVATQALKANFDVNLDMSKLNRAQTKAMMERVYGLIKEAKASPDFYRNQTSPSYMKLVFMAQALTEHYKNTKAARIVFENEEVEKSQVILRGCMDKSKIGVDELARVPSGSISSSSSFSTSSVDCGFFFFDNILEIRDLTLGLSFLSKSIFLSFFLDSVKVSSTE